MKKIIACFLAVCILFALTGCSGNMTSAENFLLAVKKMDFTAMKNELVPDEKIGSLYSALDSVPAEESLIALRNLYALMHYTIGEVSEETGSEKTVEVKLKFPNVSKICQQTKTEVMVTAETAEKIVCDMITDGTLSKTMMAEGTFSVKMVKTEDGAWKIPYAENKDFAEALAIEDMIEFFKKY